MRPADAQSSERYGNSDLGRIGGRTAPALLFRKKGCLGRNKRNLKVNNVLQLESPGKVALDVVS